MSAIKLKPNLSTTKLHWSSEKVLGEESDRQK